ncbi:hypothetical protein [Enterobacter cancerogenus]
MSSAAPILFRGISDVNDIEQLTNKRRYIAMACDFWSENGYWKKDNKFNEEFASIQFSVFSEALNLADQKLIKLRNEV